MDDEETTAAQTKMHSLKDEGRHSARGLLSLNETIYLSYIVWTGIQISFVKRFGQNSVVRLRVSSCKNYTTAFDLNMYSELDFYMLT